MPVESSSLRFTNFRPFEQFSWNGWPPYGMYGCVCVYVRMYVLCMYERIMCLPMYLCMYVCVCACMYVFTYVCIYVRTYVCIMYVLMYMYVCVCVYECTYVCTYAYVCIMSDVTR
jgi:hypothetical protein